MKKWAIWHNCVACGKTMLFATVQKNICVSLLSINADTTNSSKTLVSLAWAGISHILGSGAEKTHIKIPEKISQNICKI